MSETNNVAEMNNKIILLRKSLRSVINQTKLNLSRKVKKLQLNEKHAKSVSRKESELLCFKLLDPHDIKLQSGIDVETLKKTLTNPSLSERDRVIARILLNPLIQKTLVALKEKFGDVAVTNFLKSNDKKIAHTLKHKANIERVKKTEEKAERDKKSSKAEKKSKNDSDKAPQKIQTQSKKGSSHVKKVSTDHESSERKKNSEKFVDSFFMTSSGENYQAVVVESTERDDSDDERPYPGPDRRMKRKPADSLRKVPPYGDRTAKMPRKMIQPRSQPFEDHKKPKNVPPVQARKETIKEDQQNLHPSWLAKAKMRQSLVQPFQGTKIKFD